MLTLWEKLKGKEQVNTAMVAKNSLLGEIKREYIPYNIKLMRNEILRLLSQWTDIKENKVEIIKISKSKSQLKIKCHY